MNVVPDPQPLICLECGAANRPDSYVCKICRTPLHAGSTSRHRRPPIGRQERPPLFWAYFLFMLIAVSGLVLGEVWLAGADPGLLVVGSIVVLPVVMASAGLAASWADRRGNTSRSPWVNRFLVSLLIIIPAAFALLAATAMALAALLFAVCGASPI